MNQSLCNVILPAPNDTFPCPAPTLTEDRLVRSFILLAMAVVSYASNLYVLIALKLSRASKPKSMQALQFHLSIADLLVTAFCLTGDSVWGLSVQWKAGNLLCKAFKFGQMLSLHLSTFILVYIGIDRFNAVRYPIRSIRKSSTSKSIFSIWVISAVLSLPQAFIFRVTKGPFNEEFYQCVTHGFYEEAWQELLYPTFNIFTMFVLPLGLLINSYSCTIMVIARSSRSFSVSDELSTGCDNRRQFLERAKMKSFWMATVIILVFVIFWTPYYTMMVILLFLRPDSQMGERLKSWIFFFGMPISLVNPFIYGLCKLRKPGFKNHFNSSGRSWSSCNQTKLQENNNSTSSDLQKSLLTERGG